VQGTAGGLASKRDTGRPEPVARIVVLDGGALNPGDLSWEPLRELGECVIHERTPPAEVLSRAAGAPVLLTN